MFIMFIMFIVLIICLFMFTINSSIIINIIIVKHHMGAASAQDAEYDESEEDGAEACIHIYIYIYIYIERDRQIDR